MVAAAQVYGLVTDAAALVGWVVDGTSCSNSG